MAKLTDRQKNNIIAKWNTGSYTKTQLAKFYKVDESTIRKVINGKTKIKNKTSSVGKNISSKKGQLYVIQAGNTNFFKIGITRGEIEKRLSVLQTGNHLKLSIYHVSYHDNVLQKEKELHRKYKNCRTTGEWFHFANNEIEFITKYDLTD